MAFCEAGCLMSGAGIQCDGKECLVAAACRGERQARDRLFSLLAPLIERQARKVCGGSGMAQDIAQTSLLRVLEHLRELRRPEKLVAWTRRIVKNECRMERRNLAVRRQGQLSSWAEAVVCDGEQQLDARRELGHVLEWAPQLPPLLEQAFRLRVLEGLTTRQAAEILGVSAEALRARLARARKRLRAARGRN